MIVNGGDGGLTIGAMEMKQWFRYGMKTNFPTKGHAQCYMNEVLGEGFHDRFQTKILPNDDGTFDIWCCKDDLS